MNGSTDTPVLAIGRGNAALRHAVTDGLAQLAAVHPAGAVAKNLAGALDGYLVALGNVTPEAITAAVPVLLETSKFFPKPAEWVSAARTKQREFYESRSMVVQPAKPQYGQREPTVPTPERMDAHMAFVSLAVTYGRRLSDGSLGLFVTHDLDHAEGWQEAWTMYQGSSEAKGDFPTYDQLAAFLGSRGCDLRILDAARKRGPMVVKSHGVAITNP